MQNPDYRRAPLADLDKYGEKTSDNGHYVPASQYKSGKTHFRWVEDNRTFEAPPVENPIETPPEPLPEQVEDPTPSMQQSQAQDLVDKYTSNISSGAYSTQIFSPTPNLNTQTSESDDSFNSNTFIDPKYSLDTASEDAANSFLKAKKIEFGKGLRLQ